MDHNWGQIVQILQAGSEEENFVVLLTMRKQLTHPKSPIDDLVNAGLVPLLVGFLETSRFVHKLYSASVLTQFILVHSLKIQIEASWILINVAFGSTKQANSIVVANGIPRLLRLLKSTNLKLATQAAWTLSNLCGDGETFRDLILDEGAVTVLSELLKKSASLDQEFLKLIVWFSLNISRHSYVSLASVQPLFQPLLNLLKLKDRKLLVDTCWFFINYMNLNGTIPDAVLLNILVHFSPLLDQENPFVAESALRFVCIVVGHPSPSKNKQVVASGILSKVIALITNGKDVISRLATMCCRYLAFSRGQPIQVLIDNNVMDALVQLFDGENFSWKSKREGIFLITNLMNHGSYAQIEILANVRSMASFVNLLKSSEVEIVKATLKVLMNNINEGFNDFTDVLTEVGLKKNLENILDHIDDYIHETAFQLMNILFEECVKCSTSLLFHIP